MNTVYIDSLTGRPVVVSTRLEFIDGTIHLHTPNAVDPNDVYVVNGAIAFRPPKPGYACTFDPVAGVWVKDYETQWDYVRSDRAVLLTRSDWTQMPDVLLPNKQAWAEYRQALRDITSQPDPFNIVWPVPPSN